MNFNKWIQEEYKAELASEPRAKDAKLGWLACKKQVLKILEQYHNTPAYPYIKERIEREV